ncbi:uncharacterized protein LOC121642414 [Melanotaenia boesemani]|uniref:uncharacterized protein LOC121642414 n=1 Tax=Melanotaenia boesemani TaxID=1250792 RepID=UPI001C0503CE|nr:uncharacterized protein LOC121642414 [Melanotaenia boesemani]
MPSTPMEPLTVPTYNLRPFTRKGPRYKRIQAPFNSTCSVSQPFTKEVILLPDHTYTQVPRRARKAWLFENGLIKSAVEFRCDWNSEKVMRAITAAFHPAVEGCRLQILLPCYNKLVEPSLTANQTLSGDLVKKLFHQKSIYIRPDKVILSEEKESSSSDGERSHLDRQALDTDKMAPGSVLAFSKETVEAQSFTSNTPSILSGDQVFFCVATEDICTKEPSISADALTMTTSDAVVTIAEPLPLSSGTDAIASGNTGSLLIGPTVSDVTSRQSHSLTQACASGISSSSTSYRFVFCTYLCLYMQF